MKKIVGIMGAALMLASSMFAADFSARVVMEGSVAGGTIAVEENADKTAKANNNSAYIWQLNKKDQKDADALIVSVNGEKAGANFQFWYNYAGDDAAVKIRSTNLWLKPVDMLKITIGDLDVGTYKEMLHYWKDVAGGSLAEFDSWGAKYSSTATVAGAGINAELTPVAGLSIQAGVAAGAGKKFAEFTNNKASKAADADVTSSSSAAAYGVAVKYGNIAGLPLSVGASWRDAGNTVTKNGDKTEDTVGVKIAAIGVDYGNNYADGVYAMLNARFRLEEETTSNCAKTADDLKDNKDGIRVTAVALDNYFHFQKAAFQCALRAPVVLRTAGFDSDYQALVKEGKRAADLSYVCWSAKVQYGLSGFTPYFLFGSDLDNDGRWVLAGNDVEHKILGFSNSFNLELQPGITANVGACSVDIACRVNLGTKSTIKDNAVTTTMKDVAWSVPFTLAVTF